MLTMTDLMPPSPIEYESRTRCGSSSTGAREMTVWIALLRAVNLGARNKVPMAELRSRLTEAGFPGVRTHLQSGNVILSSEKPDVGPLIRRLVKQNFGVDEPVMVRSLARLTEIVEANPF